MSERNRMRISKEFILMYHGLGEGKRPIDLQTRMQYDNNQMPEALSKERFILLRKL